ncbi:MAG: hypothetical protein FWD61_18360 [Phycisphaerales bacterium]|nr:hypothetical protein [Phycisphaerales bacterium]
MIQKSFDQIVKADIDALLNEVSESKTLEYKLKLPGKSEDDKKEFLADIQRKSFGLTGIRPFARACLRHTGRVNNLGHARGYLC